MATGTDKDILKATIEDINKVTEQLGPDELKLLYDNLGIHPVKVEHAEATCRAGTTDTVLIARHVLRECWLQEKGADATHEELFREQDKILKRRAGKSKQGPGDFNLKHCQDQLRQLYLGPQFQVQLTPWLDDESREMETIFVNLEMEKDKDPKSKIKQKHLDRNEDLVTLETDTGLRVNRILIQGDAGSGKSTLLNNIAHKWAKLQGTNSSQTSDSPLSQFDSVFLVTIDEIDNEHKNDSLEKIIFDQILEEAPNVSQSSLKSYLQSNSERCLFLVDGIDEDSVEILDSKTSEMSKLIYYNTIYRNSCVIASARPDTLKNTSNTKLHVFTKVNITGFSDENIEEYLKKHFATDDFDHYEGLLRQLKVNHNIWDLAGKPLLLMLFCLLWDDPDQANRSLPNTRTKLYQETIVSLWKRYHNKHGLSEEDETNEESQLSELNSFLEKLGKVSLEGLLDQGIIFTDKMLFSDSDFDKATFSLALGIGILSRKRIKSKLHMSSSVKFLHTTFQDYCAGVYLAKLHFTDNDKCKQYAKKLFLKHLSLCNIRSNATDILIFCVGCKPETSTFIATQYCDAYESHELAIQRKELQFPEFGFLLPSQGNKEAMVTINNMKEMITSLGIPQQLPYTMSIAFLLNLSYEAQLSYEECASLVDIVVIRHSNLQGRVLGLNLLGDIGEFEKHIQYQLNLLKPVADTNNGLFFSTLHMIMLMVPIELPKFYPLIVSMLRYTKQLVTFWLSFRFVHASNQVSNFAEMFDALADLKHLMTLILHRAELDDTNHCLNISQSLKKLNHLPGLMLSLNVPSHTIIRQVDPLFSRICDNAFDDSEPFGPEVSLMKALPQMKTLSFLHLAIPITGTGVKCLKYVIPQLKCLALTGSFHQPFDMYEFTSCLQQAEAMEVLSVIEISLKTTISSLADQLKYMVNLKGLTLMAADLGNTEVKILVDGIKTMASLYILNLRFNPGIGSAGYYHLENLKLLPKFKQLKIMHNITPCCFNPQCSKPEPEVPGGLKRCTGCKTVSYCSKNCQREHLKAHQSPSTESPIQQPLQHCANLKCSKPETEIPEGLRRCTGCKTVSYCSSDCIREHWTVHRSVCGKNAVIEEPPAKKCKTTAEDSRLPVQKCMQEQSLPELPVQQQQPIKCCSNLTCSKPEAEVPGGLRRCSRCKTVSYCSKDCQREHWQVHKSTCQ